jgi:N utilization substance protein B
MDAPARSSARIRIRVNGLDHRLVDQAAAEIAGQAARTGARVNGPLPLPSRIEVGRAADQEEIRRHHRLVEVIGANPQTIETMRRLNLPAGVDITVVLPDEPAAPAPDGPPAKRNRRHDNRVAAVQFLLAWETQRHADLVTALFDFFQGREPGRDYFAFAEELVHGVIRDLAPIDEIVARYARNWAFGRIARVDLAILRLAVHELMRRTDIPPVVSINEAVDIAKKFSTADSGKFVNGILDKVKSEILRPARTAKDATETSPA